MSFHVGQKVVCVDDGPPPDGDMRKMPGTYWCKNDPVLGGVYTIRTVEFHRVDECQYVRLEEVVNPIRNFAEGPSELQYGARRFRPLIERKSSTSTGFEILDDIRKRETVDDIAPVKRKART